MEREMGREGGKRGSKAWKGRERKESGKRVNE